MRLVLHNYWRSSSSHRVRIALGLKKLPYEYVAVNLRTQAHHADEYRAKNPQAQVPTLEIVEDDGSTWRFTQSLPIMEYLEERWPEPSIIPGGTSPDRALAFLRARTRALAEIINSGTQPFQNPPTLRAIKKLGGDETEWPKAWLAAGLEAYEAIVLDTVRQLGRPESEIVFSAGDAPTIADCCLVPQLASARRFGVDIARYPVLVEIEKQCLAIPAFADAAPENQPDAVRT